MQNAMALITRANRGIGRALVDQLSNGVLLRASS
jgi:NAD(P)-dependent dehydrogenase (short-subunit alcohol dehydrogenase family)